MRSNKAIRVLIFIASVMITTIDCTGHRDAVREKGYPTRVLFIGNSLTYSNDLPDTFAKLAQAGGHEVEVEMQAPSDYTLSLHVRTPRALEKVEQQQWDFVVLQGHNYVAVDEERIEHDMYPAIRLLDAKIRETGATTLLFMTWGFRGGSPSYGYDDFFAMQTRLESTYTEIAEEIDAMVAPVGIAWKSAIEQDPKLMAVLWDQSDAIHPATAGTYLTACVFYAVIFHESPENLEFRDELSEQNARFLQGVAASTVLDNPGRWNQR